jgi:hypothetical protein
MNCIIEYTGDLLSVLPIPKSIKCQLSNEIFYKNITTSESSAGLFVAVLSGDAEAIGG